MKEKYKNLVCGFLFVFFVLFSLLVHASEEEAEIALDENGKTVISDQAEDPEMLFSDIHAGDRISITWRIRNDYQSEQTDYAGFYLKAYTDYFDPEEAEYSYTYWASEAGKALTELVSLEEDDERYEECREILDFYSDKLHKDTFGREALTEEEQGFYNVLHQLEIVVDPLSPYTCLENPIQIGMNGLIPLAGLNPGEEVDCHLSIRIPETLTEEELEILRGILWKLSVRKLGAHPGAEVMIEYTNEPKNGAYFVAMPEVPEDYDEPEEWESIDCAALTHIVVTNTGNVPIRFYQLMEGESGYRHGKSLSGAPYNGKVECIGAYGIIREDAEAGGKELIARFEAVLDNPDIPEHIIATDSVWIPAGIDDVAENVTGSSQNSADTTQGPMMTQPEREDLEEGVTSAGWIVWLPITAGICIIAAAAAYLLKRKGRK